MTAHDHTTRVPGCYRCELGVDEALDGLAAERDELEAERDRLREALEAIHHMAHFSKQDPLTLPTIEKIARRTLATQEKEVGR